MVKRWTNWEIGYYSPPAGRWRKITTIRAPDKAAARIKGHAALCRLSRVKEYRMWKGGGCEVLEVSGG